MARLTCSIQTKATQNRRGTYADTTTVELLLVHAADGSIGLGLAGEGLQINEPVEALGKETNDETEAPGSASLTVLHDDALALSIRGAGHEKKLTSTT